MRRSAKAPDIREIRLTAREVRPADEVIRVLAARHGAADGPEALAALAGSRDALPARLVDALSGVRSRRGCPVTVVRRPRPAEDVGPTPPHWRVRERGATVAHDLWLALVAVQVGEPVCWQTLQDGRLFNDVLPIEGQEQAQTGHSSLADLDVHVEDAFDDDRCDVLALLCLRNPRRTATTVATGSRLRLGEEDREVLSQPRFAIRADPEHVRASASGDLPPVWRPVLFGGPRPYLRVDPAYTATAPGDDAAVRAFTRLCGRLERELLPVRLEPGDLLLIDNYRAVHGREPFQARYDGTDRWLRKLTLTFDLQRSSGRRRAGGRALSLS